MQRLVTNDKTFDVHQLSDIILNIIMQEGTCDKQNLLLKITSCLQKNVDQKLVPRNYNQYESKKRRDAWRKEIKKVDYEMKYWKEIVKAIVGENIQKYYDELNNRLDEQGFRKVINPDTQITCFYCERIIDAANFGGEIGIFWTKDHIIPKSKFGKNHHSNLVGACNDCNNFKSDLTIKQFIKRIQQNIARNISYRSITVDLYPTIIKNVQKLYVKNLKSETAQ